MLTLITSDDQKQEIEKRVEQLQSLTVTVRLPSQLLRFLSKNFYNEFPKEGFTFDFQRNEVELFLNNMIPIWSGVLELKSTYLAAWMALSQCFPTASLHDYLASLTEESDLASFPHVDWIVEEDGKVIETNQIYSYIGSDLLLVNPSRVVISHPKSIFENSENAFTLLTIEKHRIPEPWRVTLDDSLASKVKSALFNTPFQLETAGPGPSSIFRTESKTTGRLEIYAKVALPKTKLSFFYTIADRVLSQPLLTAREGQNESTFNLLETMMELTNPTLQDPNALKTSVYFASKYGVPKFAFLGNP
jgi:hypothetical protein